MNANHREWISILFTISIVALALFIIHRFIPSLIWAGIIAISTYPLYRPWSRWFGQWKNTSALLFTGIFFVLIIAPLSWVVTILIQETQWFINYLHLVNQDGGQAPAVLSEIPMIGEELVKYWDVHFAQPGNIKSFLSNIHLSLTPASYYIKQVGIDLFHRSFQLGFTLLSLFFFYRDGQNLFHQINSIGEGCLGRRWFQYAERLPSALQATVNGTVLVGICVGILMGICYDLVDFPAPTLVGFITAFAAMIPFAVPLVFGVVALVLFANGGMIAALIVLAWGTIVMFIADHFVKPALIGGATQLPFLVVLFGILGGVETLGLLGLFVGPMIMVLLMTLWNELQCDGGAMQ